MNAKRKAPRCPICGGVLQIIYPVVWESMAAPGCVECRYYAFYEEKSDIYKISDLEADYEFEDAERLLASLLAGKKRGEMREMQRAEAGGECTRLEKGAILNVALLCKKIRSRGIDANFEFDDGEFIFGIKEFGGWKDCFRSFSIFEVFDFVKEVEGRMA